MNYCLVYVISFFVIRLFKPQTGWGQIMKKKVSESENKMITGEYVSHDFVKYSDTLKLAPF